MKLENLCLAREGVVAAITLNRPERRNALSLELMLELVACLDELGRDREIRVVILRGAQDRVRSQYRIRALIDYMRSSQITVGYRVGTPRVTMEMRALDMVQPDFAKVLAPESNRDEFWRDFVSEARVAGIEPQSLIVAGLETDQQVELARQAGIRFGQGNAVRPSFKPPESPGVTTSS